MRCAVLMLLIIVKFNVHAQPLQNSGSRQFASDSGFSHMYVGILFGYQVFNNSKLNQWFSVQGMGDVNRQHIGSFVFGGFLGDAGMFEFKLSGLVKNSSVSQFQIAAGLMVPVWHHRRSGLFAGFNFSHTWNKVYGIRNRIPPRLRADTVGRNLSSQLLNLTQNGIGLGPEIRYVYHIGPENKAGLSLMAGVGLSFHALTKWKFTEDFIDGQGLISKPDIPSIKRLSGYCTIGLAIRIR